MRVDETGGTDREVTAESLLAAAEQAFLRSEFDVVQPLLQRLRNTFGEPDTDPADVRYGTLLAAMAARVEDWPKAVRLCPDAPVGAETGVIHFLAVSALRELAREDRHADAGVAAVAIVLWAHLLDEENSDDIRALVTGRRGEPLPDALWEQALGRLRGRIADLLRALDARAGRDALAAWHTAWEAECADGVIVSSDIPTDAGPHALIPLVDAAWYLVDHGRSADLLSADTARHLGLNLWAEEGPTHRTYAVPLARALADRGRDRVRGGRWSEALADIGTAAQLGHALKSDEKDAVIRAWRNVGRGRNGLGNDPLIRIAGLEQAYVLLPRDTALAAELTAELVRRGKQVAHTDPLESRSLFKRALAVTPRDPAAQAELDGLLGDEASFANAVRGMLARDPACGPARRWLERHSEERAVALAVSGHTDEAQAAVREMLRHKDPTQTPLRKNNHTLSGLLLLAARRTDAGSRDGLERRVELLRTAATIPSRIQGHVRENLHEALLLLAEHLEATAAPSDVIDLFLRDLMRTGVSTRFDKVVENAYVLRATVRKRTGDLGGAQRDLACAEAIGDGLPLQAPLFGSAPRTSRRDDPRQDTLF
ncbi:MULTISPECIES: hypothetical protein [unclassified Streptomyces]|uniref:hypothetical protein n=1 Tax=unclassified Streptomyces TaxID=2593676 RepID=UPI001E482080|nr:hypothetical protein [Streptomyces sp. CB02980]MCB8905783.1 hypothetical protein [Streptomyces sp. CB02980]